MEMQSMTQHALFKQLLDTYAFPMSLCTCTRKKSVNKKARATKAQSNFSIGKLVREGTEISLRPDDQSKELFEVKELFAHPSIHPFFPCLFALELASKLARVVA